MQVKENLNNKSVDNVITRQEPVRHLFFRKWRSKSTSLQIVCKECGNILDILGCSKADARDLGFLDQMHKNK